MISSMNSFDAAVYIAFLIAVVTGYNAGLLRSIATIFGYLSAMPIAVAVTSRIPAGISGNSEATPWVQNTLLFFGTFLVTGILLSVLLRLTLSETVGSDISIVDRLAGSGLGAIRTAILAVTMVLIFDQLIPAGRQPTFLSNSRLKPILSLAGQKGLKSLPPDIMAFLDQLKKDRLTGRD
jgi:membrane protein required for colicin V production